MPYSTLSHFNQPPGFSIAGGYAFFAAQKSRENCPVDAAQIGDNVYAGHDGNVYKKTDNGWQSMVGGSNRANPANTAQVQNLDRESAARSFGNDRLNNVHDSSQVMNR